MGKSETITYSLEQIDFAVNAVMAHAKPGSVVTLTGTLGAGKTTLIQGVFERLGVQGPVQSPTFTYINEYSAAKNVRLYHFDLYRLHTQEEFMSLGFDEYLYQPNAICFIEWPGIIDVLLTHDVCRFELDYEGVHMRRLTWSCNG